MLALKEVKRSIKLIRLNKLEYAFLFFQLIVFSDMVRQTLSDGFLVFNLLLTLILLVKSKRKINKITFLILGIYLALCIYPVIKYGFAEYRSYIGYGIRILTAGLILNYFKRRFIECFENLVFLLAYISIPLFVIQLIDPHVFNFLTPISRLFMTNERMWYNTNNGITMHQYCFLFVFNGWAQNRNSGFMWEPAAFGAVLIWASIFNVFINKFNFNKKLIVLLIAGFTTFSVGFYIYAILFLFIYIIQNGLSLKNTGIMVVLISVFTFLLTQTSLFENQYELIGSKFKSQSKPNMNKIQSPVSAETDKVNRIEGYYYNIQKVINSPLGYGMHNENVIYQSANGLIDLLTKWGISGFIIIILCYYKNVKVLKKIYYPKINKLSYFLIVVLFILPLAGNPFYNKTFVFMIILFPMYLPGSIITSKYESKKQFSSLFKAPTL